MTKRRTREDDDFALMPPPSAPIATIKSTSHRSIDADYPSTQSLAPASSPHQPYVTASTSRHPSFGRFSSAGPRGRNALDSIGYAPENIPTPRTTRPSSAVGITKKRQRGLKLLPTASTSPVRPKLPLLTPEPPKHASTSSKCDEEPDDHEYIVDSSDDEGPVPFNLQPKSLPRSSKIARISQNIPSTHPSDDRTVARPSAISSPSRLDSGAVASSSRLPIGATPARRKYIAPRLGITPARPVATSSRPTTTPARLTRVETPIDPTPIPLNLVPAAQTPRQVNSPFLPPANTPGSRSHSSGSSISYRPLAVHLESGRLFQVNLASSSIRPKPLSSLVELAAGTKRGPGSKSRSPSTGPKRPRISAPSPPIAEDIIVVSSSDDDIMYEKGPSADGPEGRDERADGEQEREEMEGVRERRPPSPSPSLGDYRPTPSDSRSRSHSASSDVILIGSRPHSASERRSNRKASLDSNQEAQSHGPGKVVTKPTATSPSGEAPGIPPPTKGAPPSTPRSHRSSSSEQPRISRKRAVRRVESIEDSEPTTNETGTGRRTKRGAQVPEPSPSPEEGDALSSLRKRAEASSSRLSGPLPERMERATLSPKKSSPPVNLGSPPPSPHWTGNPLFRPATTSVSSLTVSSKDRLLRKTLPETATSRSRLGETELPPPRDVERHPPHDTAQPPSPGPTETHDDDPLQSMYDEPICQLPQYRVVRPSHAAPSSPERPIRQSMAPSYSNFSYISSMPPPTITSVLPASRPAVRRLRMDCVLLPRASKATRRALERFVRKDKGKGKDPSEYPSQQSSAPTSQTGDPSTPGSTSQAPAIKYLVIDPQLALPSHYEYLPPEIEESSEKYCHCCRTRSIAGRIKMRCGSMTTRRKKGVPHGEAHECGLYWCQRCIAKHDIPFNPLLENFQCPLCTGTCECDVCRRERGQEPLGRRAMKTVKVKPGKRSLDAFVKGRVASGSGSRVSNPTAAPSGPIVEMSHSTSALLDPLEPSELTSTPLNPDARTDIGPSTTVSARRVSAPTMWYGRRPPPHLCHRRASEGHAVSTEAHIFIPRGPRRSELAVDTTLEQVDESLEYSDGYEPESEGDELADNVESAVEDRHQVFEGDYSAVGDASLLGADSGTFELGIEHGPDNSTHDAVDEKLVDKTDELEVPTNSARVVAEDGMAGPEVVSESGGLTIKEVVPSIAHTPTGTPSPATTEVLIGALAYPPSDSDGSQANARTPVPPAPEDIIPINAGTLGPPTLAGVLDDAPTAGILGDVPVEASCGALTEIFNESIHSLAESDSAALVHDYGSASLSRQTSETDEFPSTSEADEPRLRTPNFDLVRAEFIGDSIEEPELNPELNPALGQLHPEGTFATVPCISRGDGGDYTIYGSLQDISLFNGVTDCSDDTHGIALSSPQSEPGPAACGSLSEYYTHPRSIAYFYHQLELEPLGIFELEGFESELEHESDLALGTDPESAKSTTLETPSPSLEPDTRSNLGDIRNLFDTHTDEPRTNPFIFPTKENQARVRKILQSQFTQNVEPDSRATRSRTRKSTMERGKFLRSKRSYGVDS
ncbi:hypothetical protein RHS04_03915 [Rhizoctonia solani]|uniref:Zinc-finger domain-containing protein n=1 Tax=Rhizoctonia solani TaxID=456999 RepID=A0A8H7HA57_9AGAM|nr:hypothetical protein RHS04_03915 [Rhizoctonia solani]